MPSGRRETATAFNVERISLKGGFKNYTTLPFRVFDFVQIAHVDFVFLLLTRHSIQASSALASFVGSA